MPDLTTTLHLDMLEKFRTEKIPLKVAAERGYAAREVLQQAVATGELRAELQANGTRMLSVADLRERYGEPNLYGLQWGDPDSLETLQRVRDQYLAPLLSPESTVVEIGPGGGRWTRYLLGVKRLYAVDFHQELLDELAKNFDQPNIVRIKNSGSDFPGVPSASADLIFSFGVFVHLDLPIIESYLSEMRRILKPDGVAFLQYSDKSKPAALKNSAFSDNTPEIMRGLLNDHGYQIVREDTEILWHSSIVIFKMRL